MDTEVQQRFYKLGEGYWWLEGKYKLVESYIRNFLTLKGSPLILEGGCGPGNFLPRLKNYGKCFGADLSFDALRYAKDKGHQVFNADACRYPIREGSVDLVVMVDVLEHIAKEGEALKELRRIIKKEGYLLVSVPAFQALWGSHDEIYGHFRRYQAKELADKLTTAGFKVLKNSYIQPLFFLPLWLLRKFKGKNGSDDFYPFPKWVNRFLTELLALEAFFLKRWNFSFGVAIVCLAQKVD